jgi:hypothetical protein
MGLRVPIRKEIMLTLVTAFLTLLLVAESVYILLRRQPTNRFKAVEGYQGIVAFDTATGQLCKTLRTKSAAEIERSAEKSSADSALQFVANLPRCADIR